MIPELGHLSLIIALTLAVLLATLPLYGSFSRHSRLMLLARPIALGQFLFVLFAFGCLAYSFWISDFSVENVAANSNTKLPAMYRLTATWGSHEGSLLLWTVMLAGWTFAVSVFSRNLPLEVIARVLAVMGWIAIGFLLFMLMMSNPFARLLPAALEGNDLNPLLQDPGMVIHPPMLYMGYVGFSVAFAFAIAALLGGKLDATWARWSRPWTTAAWCFLTLGICLGSAWAYYELGWGGWWFWDPVENASFMPWLLGTALIHSLAVTEKRGIFKSWTVLLAIIAFSLSLLGTFLVRSGVLTSVHAFATDPERGIFILIFLTIVIGASLMLYAWRAPTIGLAQRPLAAPGSFTPSSRESLLLANNVLLGVAMLVVLLGTLYPLFIDALGMGKISVGAPYFDLVFYVVMAPALFLLACGPVATWKHTRLADLVARLRGAFVLALVAAIMVPWLMGKWSPLIMLSLFLACWIIASTLLTLYRRLHQSFQQQPPGAIAPLQEPPQGPLLARSLEGAAQAPLLARSLAAWRANSLSYYGMHVAHLGVAVFILGVTLVKGYEIERDVRLGPGQSYALGGYDFKFVSMGSAVGSNYQSARATFEVSRDGKLLDVMHPEKRTYTTTGQTMTETAIDSGLTRDLYVSLGEPVEQSADGAWGVRIYIKPFIDWIWGGCILMALGGALAIADKRYRIKARQRETVRTNPDGMPTHVASAALTVPTIATVER